MSAVISISTDAVTVSPGSAGSGASPGPASTAVAGAMAPPAARRPGPVGAISDAGAVEAIRQVLADSPFHGEGYRKVWARLRHAGLRTSKERVRRLMRENGLAAAPGRPPPRPAQPRRHDYPRGHRRDVGNRHDRSPHCRGWSGRGVRRRRSLLGDMRRHPCRPPRHPPRGARAGPPGRHRTLRRGRKGTLPRVSPSATTTAAGTMSREPSRNPPPRPHRVQADLQRKLADRAARPSLPGPIPTRHCPPSGPMGRFEVIEQRRVSGSS